MNNANGQQIDAGGTTANKAKRAGAPHGNANRTTHGVRGYLTLGTYPKGGNYVRKLLGQFREALEAEITARHGEVSIFHAALIQSAARHEGRALLLNRWLRTETELSVSDRLAIVKGITDASDSRDRCLKAMGLDESPASADPWKEFDRTRTLPAVASDPTAANGSEHSAPGDNAADAKPSDVTASNGDGGPA